MNEQPIVLHANRIKGLIIISLYQIFSVLFAFIVIEISNFFPPYVLFGCLGIGMIAGYKFAFKNPHLFIKEIIIGADLKNSEPKNTNGKIEKVFLEANDIKSYNIIKGIQMRFGYCLRLWTGEKDLIYFIVPKINEEIITRGENFKKITIGEFYQKKPFFREDFSSIENFLKLNSVRVKKSSDWRLKMLYILPIIFYFLLLGFCIGFPIYIINLYT